MISVGDARRCTAVRAAWMFDGVRGELLPEPVVVVAGGRIVAAGTRLPVPDGAEPLDLAGATLLPGLVDGHTHLAFDASADPVAALAARDDAAAAAAMAVAARRATAGGITTVRDLGDRGYLALRLRAAARTDPTLPTILAAGPPLTTTGGHCHFLGGAADGEDALRSAVREHADRGVDVIKIMASGGNLTAGSDPGASQYGVAELRAVVAEAHRLSLPVVAHAHGTDAIRAALAAGVDGLEHVTFMTADGVDPAPRDVLDALLRAGRPIGLTLGMVLPPGISPPPAIQSRIPLLIANLAAMHAAGVPVVLGSDGGIGPPKPHDSLRWAVGDLVTHVDATPHDALLAATSRAAAAIGLGDRKGRLAPGYDADILAVDGDPLTDPAALHAIRAVLVRGHRLR